MAQDIVNKNQDISYTNLDFSSIYTEIVNLAKQLSYRWDPSISDESDPGVVLLKLSALIADKMNYNIDKSVLESFPLSVTQEGNARQLYEQLGYYMNWYEAATVPINITWIGEKLSSDVVYTIPRFTIVTDSETSLSYTIIGTINNNELVVSDIKLPADGTTVQVIAMEGTPTTYSFLGETKITSQMIDENNRLYFETKYIAQNGIFVRNIGNDQDNYLQWQRVDNLYEQPYDGLRYKFGVDSKSDVAYLEFPDNYAELIGSGIEIVYLIIDPEFNNIPTKTLDRFLVNITPIETSDVILSIDNVKIENILSASGHKNVETINEAYTNYKRTVGTFKTLITLRDYLNYILLEGEELCSNGFVTDRSNDPQLTYKIMSTVNGIDSLITQVESDDIYESVNIDRNAFENDDNTYYTYNVSDQQSGFTQCTNTDTYITGADTKPIYFIKHNEDCYESIHINSFDEYETYYTLQYNDVIGTNFEEVEYSTPINGIQYFIKLENTYESVDIDESSYDANIHYIYSTEGQYGFKPAEGDFDENTVYYELVTIYRSVSVNDEFDDDLTYYVCVGNGDSSTNYEWVEVQEDEPITGVQYFIHKPYGSAPTYESALINKSRFDANKTHYYTHNMPSNEFITAITFNENEHYFKKKDSDKLTPFSLKFYLLQDAVSVNSKNTFNQTFEMISSEDLPSINALIENTSHIQHTYEDILPFGDNTYKLTGDTTRDENKSYYRYNSVGDVYEFIPVDYYYAPTEDEEVYVYVDETTGKQKTRDYYNYNVQYDYYYKVDITRTKNPKEANLYQRYEIPEDINPLSNGWYELDVEALMPHVAYFRAKYPLLMTITTYTVVGMDVQSDIKTNVLNALYNNLNSSQLEFGDKIELDYITEIVLAADARIKSVLFDNINYEIEAVFYDEHKKQFKAVILPNIITQPDFTNEESVLSYQISKDIIAKSILAGTTKLLDEDTNFNYHLNQYHLYNSEDDIYTITPETVIDMNNVSTSINSDNSLVKNYTLRENEVIKIYRPKLTDVNEYATGIHYEYLINNSIDAHQSYKLSKREFMIFYQTQLDANSEVVGYTVKAYTNGAVIKPSFSLREQSSQDGLSEYFRTQWQDSILQQDDTVYNCDTTSIYWTSVIQNSSSIINNVIQGSNSIQIQELNTVTIKPEDGYSFYWVLNNEQKTESTGKKFYELFGEFDSDSDSDKRNNGLINTYTLKSGETLYYADKDFKHLATLGEGTVITRNCGINEDYVEIDSDDLLEFVDYRTLYDNNTLIEDGDGNVLAKGNGLYEKQSLYEATKWDASEQFTNNNLFSKSDENYILVNNPQSGNEYYNLNSTLYTDSTFDSNTKYYNDLYETKYVLNDNPRRASVVEVVNSSSSYPNDGLSSNTYINPSLCYRQLFEERESISSRDLISLDYERQIQNDVTEKLTGIYTASFTSISSDNLPDIIGIGDGRIIEHIKNIISAAPEPRQYDLSFSVESIDDAPDMSYSFTENNIKYNGTLEIGSTTPSTHTLSDGTKINVYLSYNSNTNKYQLVVFRDSNNSMTLTIELTYTPQETYNSGSFLAKSISGVNNTYELVSDINTATHLATLDEITSGESLTSNTWIKSAFTNTDESVVGYLWKPINVEGDVQSITLYHITSQTSYTQLDMDLENKELWYISNTSKGDSDVNGVDIIDVNDKVNYVYYTLITEQFTSQSIFNVYYYSTEYDQYRKVTSFDIDRPYYSIDTYTDSDEKLIYTFDDTTAQPVFLITDSEIISGYTPTQDYSILDDKEYYVIQMKSTSGLYEYKNGMYSPCGTTTYDVFEQISLDSDDVDTINPLQQHYYQKVNYAGYVIEDTYRAKYIDDEDYEDVLVSRPRYVLSTDTNILNENIFVNLYNNLSVNNTSSYPETIDITANNASQYSPLIENLYEVDRNNSIFYDFYEQIVHVVGDEEIYEYQQIIPDIDSVPVQEKWYEQDDQGEYYLTSKLYSYTPQSVSKSNATTPFEEIDSSSISSALDYYYKFAYSDKTYRIRLDSEPYIAISASGNNVPTALYNACYKIKISSPNNDINISNVDNLWSSTYSTVLPSGFKTFNFKLDSEGDYYFVTNEHFTGTPLNVLASNAYTYYVGVVNDNDTPIPGFFINNETLFKNIVGNDPEGVESYQYSIQDDDKYVDVSTTIITQWYNGIRKVGTSYIDNFPLFLLPIYYKFKYLVSIRDNTYYKLKTYATSSFGLISPWSCDSLSSDYIVDNPILNLTGWWQPVQNNCSITITENDMFSLSEGDTISIVPKTTNNIQQDYMKYPVFSNTESILNLDNYYVSYITSNNSVSTLEELNIENMYWRAYSSLLLNTSDSSGQTVLTNHSISFMDKDGDEIFNIPSDIDNDIFKNQQVKFQLKYPVNNKSGSNIEVITYDDLGNEKPNAVYVFYNVYDNDYVTYLSTSETTLKFANGTRIINIPFGLSTGQYLLPITTIKGVTITCNLIQRNINNSNVKYIDIKDYASQNVEFTGDKTHYLYINIDDSDTYTCTLRFTCNTDINIVLKDIFKFDNNELLKQQNVFDDIFTKIKLLDNTNIFNYTFQPNENDLIENPMLPSAFWDKNHVFNKNTIAQLDLSSTDNLVYRFITSK